MGMGIGYGKVILVGEHFVVYGHKSIVLPLDRYISVEVTRGNKIHRDPGISHILNIAQRELGLSESLRISKIQSHIPESAGLGSSAALCVATLRAILDEMHMLIDEKRQFEISKLMENYYHGNSSGIDVYMAMYNKPVVYERTDHSISISDIKLDMGLNLGIKILPRKRSAGEIIRSVREFRDREPQRFRKIEESYRGIFEQAKLAIERKDGDLLAEVMNRNHELLREIGISNEKVERVIREMKDRGVIGAKISGAGDGGAVIGLYRKSDYSFDIEIKI